MPEEKVEQQYSVLINCPDEPYQLAVISELDRNGIDCRAVVAGFQAPAEKPPTDPPKIETAGKVIKREVAIKRTPRVIQLEGIFDVPPSKRQKRVWNIDFTLDRPWSIGLIVSPSVSGKTTLARELFGKQLIAGWPWPEAESIVDAFPTAMSIAEITGLLSSVGFSSPPSWLKPFHVLSNGEQFRVTLARTLAEAPDLAVVDEFTSVVDRTVAQVGSSALAKTIRATGRRFVAVACHYDIEEWLQPDRLEIRHRERAIPMEVASAPARHSTFHSTGWHGMLEDLQRPSLSEHKSTQCGSVLRRGGQRPAGGVRQCHSQRGPRWLVARTSHSRLPG